MRGRNFLRNMFGLDWRSLALMRIGLALVILLDLAISASDLRVFYTNEGVLPSQVVRDNYAPDLALYLWHGSAAYISVLFALEAVFAVMMLVGYRTRLATIGCLVLLLSRQARNPLVLFGADMIEHIALFWAAWLPLNRRYSVDAWLGRVEKPKETRYLGLAGIGVVLQYMLIYAVSGIVKTGATWHIEHSAVYYALSLQMYARPLGQWFNQFDWLTAWLTIGTLYLELYGPLLFILPFRRGWGRLLGCLLFGTLQLGFGLCMQMGLFWVVMNAFLLMLLPEEFWTWLAEPAGRWLAKRLHLPVNAAAAEVPQSQPQQPLAPGRPWVKRGCCLLRDTVMVGVIVLMFLLNYDTLPGHAKPVLNDQWHRLTNDCGLEQCFNMFAPDPQLFDGWLVVRGWTQAGDEVDVVTGDSPASLDAPENIADTYGDERWGSYLLDLTFDDFAPYRENYVNYLAQNWDNRHPQNEQLTKIELLFMRSFNGPNHTFDGPVPMVMWTEEF